MASSEKFSSGSVREKRYFLLSASKYMRAMESFFTLLQPLA